MTVVTKSTRQASVDRNGTDQLKVLRRRNIFQKILDGDHNFLDHVNFLPQPSPLRLLKNIPATSLDWKDGRCGREPQQQQSHSSVCLSEAAQPVSRCNPQLHVGRAQTRPASAAVPPRTAHLIPLPVITLDLNSGCPSRTPPGSSSRRAAGGGRAAACTAPSTIPSPGRSATTPRQFYHKELCAGSG